ncbi:uncharacterized protein si:ch211-51h4.2 isoform X1 [Triplophysa dalaica]|uniref:uncharacterized protein si:ch211-51h4.2 isoform X1 n=2 Tax=Triplophysa dalaica TaxID=1582913 RepID=UPI0024DF6EF3|nr:uncharacterized protein si:ch211-51h4.2 isoform X1 [Triplophysa dalaica]
MMATAAEEICSSLAISENTETSVSFKSARKNQDRTWKLRFIYLQCYFLTIATILGTGILGLPGTIARAGLLPFLTSFLIGFLVQGLLIYLFVDLLQRCRLAQLESIKPLETSERISMDDVGSEERQSLNTEEEEYGEDVEEADTGLLQRDATPRKQKEELQPNLHILGVLFLGKHTSRAFNFVLLFQFVSIGISYVLAGSEAYAALFHTSPVYVIPAFTWTLSLGILLAQTIIQPITSLLTLLKGILLVITVAVTFVVGSEVHQETTNDFTQIGKPFLMGTVALGGIVNVMPFLFSEISQVKSQVLWFRRAVLGGLATCTLLNILWCWAVLEIVPQLAVQSVHEQRVLNNSAGQTEKIQIHTFVYSNISLEESEKAGEIATIPLTKIITQRYSRFSWVAELIQIFITISISVSFLVMGTAMKHTIDGLVSTNWTENAEWMARISARLSPHSSQWRALAQSIQHCRRFFCGFSSFLAFGVIFVVSACDPKGFVVMLDKVVSFSLNTEVGLFIFLMLRTSRSERFKHITVPLPVTERLFSLYWLLPIYFLFAVFYDVFQSLLEITENMSHTLQANSSLL